MLIERKIIDFGKTKIAYIAVDNRVSWDYYHRGRPPFKRLLQRLERRKQLRDAQ